MIYVEKICMNLSKCPNPMYCHCGSAIIHNNKALHGRGVYYVKISNWHVSILSGLSFSIYYRANVLFIGSFNIGQYWTKLFWLNMPDQNIAWKSSVKVLSICAHRGTYPVTPHMHMHTYSLMNWNRARFYSPMNWNSKSMAVLDFNTYLSKSVLFDLITMFNE